MFDSLNFIFFFLISYPLIIDDIISEIDLQFTFPEEPQTMILNLLQRLSKPLDMNPLLNMRVDGR